MQSDVAMALTRPRRLADLESKLTDILGLLSGSYTSSSGDQSFNVPDVDLPGIDIHVGSDLADWLRYENPTVSEMIQPPLSAEEALNTEHGTLTISEALGNSDSAWITDLGLSPAVLPHLLDNFRRMSAYFPFVRLPEDITAESMVNDRPFLLLAAVTNGSSRYRHLQGALIEKFKEALSQSLILAGEKDLDLLQGLLLHLAWYGVSLFNHIVRPYETTVRELICRISGFISTSTPGALRHTDTYKSQSVWWSISV
jgi:hypothetical protein